jgi:hypothetical protein
VMKSEEVDLGTSQPKGVIDDEQWT